MTNPLMFSIWNREYENLNRPETHKGFNLAWVHGHDSKDPIKDSPHIINLDNQLGKEQDAYEGSLELHSICPEFLSDGLKSLIAQISFKADQLKKDGHKDAADAARTLHTQLLLSSRIVSPNEFISKCNDYINNARPKLEQHRGFKKIFMSILWVLFYLRLITRPIDKTDPVLKLDELVKELERLKEKYGASEDPTTQNSPNITP
jgi:hypothetical protein